MDTERLYRKSMPGILFLGVLFLVYILRGGDARYVVDYISQGNFSFLIAILITTPIIGLIISSVAIAILHKLQGHEFYIVNPPSSKIKEIVLDPDHKLLKKAPSQKLTRKELQDFYPIYQAYIRVKLNDQSLKFLERRWNFYWIHINNIAAIIFSILFSFVLNYKKSNQPIKLNCWLLVGATIGVLAYLLAALHQSRFLKKEITQLEEEAVIRSKKEENIKKNTKNP